MALVAWFVPGMGHILLRRWGRGVAIFFLVSAMAGTGLLLRGYVFPPQAGDAFEWLGLISNLGTGGLYFLTLATQAASPDVSQASGDYGTRFFAAAGVLNLLCVLDALQIAAGQEE